MTTQEIFNPGRRPMSRRADQPVDRPGTAGKRADLERQLETLCHANPSHAGQIIASALRLMSSKGIGCPESLQVAAEIIDDVLSPAREGWRARVARGGARYWRDG